MDTAVQPLFTSDCAGCHSDYASGSTWDKLVGTSSSSNSSYFIIDPYDADNSWVVIKLEGTQGSGNGQQMPKNGSPWSSADIQTVRDWIDEGAWK